MYATIVDNVFRVLILFNAVYKFLRVIQRQNVLLMQYLIYSLFLNRHYLISSWTRLNFLLRVIYFDVNEFLSTSKSSRSSSRKSCRYTSFDKYDFTVFRVAFELFVDLLDVSLEIYRSIHEIEALMSFLLSLFHVILEIKQSKESLSQSFYVHEIIVSFFNLYRCEKNFRLILKCSVYHLWHYWFCSLETFFVNFRMSFFFAVIKRQTL